MKKQFAVNVGRSNPAHDQQLNTSNVSCRSGHLTDLNTEIAEHIRLFVQWRNGIVSDPPRRR